MDVVRELSRVIAAILRAVSGAMMDIMLTEMVFIGVPRLPEVGAAMLGQIKVTPVGASKGRRETSCRARLAQITIPSGMLPRRARWEPAPSSSAPNTLCYSCVDDLSGRAYRWIDFA